MWFRRVIWHVFLTLVAATRTRAAELQDPPAYRLYGLNFSPYKGLQNPNFNVQIPEMQIRERMAHIAPYTTWIRTFGASNGLERSGAIARELGLKIAMGAWLGRDQSANGTEIENLVAACNRGEVDIAIVGSEVLLREDLSEAQLIQYMQAVRSRIPSTVPVTTVETHRKLLAHPNVLNESQVVLVNLYPLWEEISLQYAIENVHQWYFQVKAAAAGKPVIVAESGWQSFGPPQGAAVPSPANAASYFNNFVSWARANDVPYFYFSAFDEPWKGTDDGWGIWDTGGYMKPGMPDVFNGLTVPDNWSNAGVPCGPGNPAVTYTLVPPLGFRTPLQGKVCHVVAANYRVVSYIFVGGTWWVKPYDHQRTVGIMRDGTWAASITTGGIDESATKIASFVIPAAYTPPGSVGVTLPPDLFQAAVASIEVTRTPHSVSGRIADASGIGIGDVDLQITGGQPSTQRTTADGFYSFYALAQGGNYVITPTKPSVVFQPVSRTISNMTGALQGVDFVAAVLPGSPSAPLPQSGSYGVGQIPLLRWLPGDAATVHDVYLSTANSPTFLGSTLGNTFTPPNALRNGVTYYWKVVAKNLTGSMSSNVWSFTTQSVPSLGVYRNGLWVADWNGNWGWDAGDAPHLSVFGLPGDMPVMGDWNESGQLKMGVYRGGFWFVDWNGNRQWDAEDANHVIAFGLPGDIPIMGDWNGSGQLKMGVYRNGIWFVDWNGNRQWDSEDANHVTAFGLPSDVPIMGDWSGSGQLKMGVYRNGFWLVDWNGNRQWDSEDANHVAAFGLPGHVPVMGDWNGSGNLKTGVFHNGIWFVDWNGNGGWDSEDANHILAFGLSGDVPVMGEWNPTSVLSLQSRVGPVQHFQAPWIERQSNSPKEQDHYGFLKQAVSEMQKQMGDSLSDPRLRHELVKMERAVRDLQNSPDLQRELQRMQSEMKASHQRHRP